MGFSLSTGSRVRVGSLTVTKIEEKVYTIPIELLVPKAGGDALWAERPYLDLAHLADDGTFGLSISGYLIEAAGRRILVDTCIGTEHRYGDRNSPFLERLADAGAVPGAIDLVVCTHAHFDHVGWNTTIDGGMRRPTFPRARYVFSKVEWDSCCSGAVAGDSDTGDDAHIVTSVGPIVAGGVGDLIIGEHRLTDEIVLVPTPGHSPGHQSVLIESEGARAVITGDLVHHPVQFTHPEWHSEPDDDVAAATATRRDFLDRVCDEDILVVGSHFAGPWHGRVRSVDGRPRFVPSVG